MADTFSIFKKSLQELHCIFKEYEPLDRHTTFKIGGKCRFLVLPDTAAQIREIMKKCHELQIPYFVLGKGSNILADDNGYQGVIIKLTDNFSKITVNDTVISCEAGASMAAVCYAAYENGLTGLEFAWGIPGTVGGGLYMNAGAYNGEIKDVVIGAEHITDQFELADFKKENLLLSYRHSAYTDLPGYCITKVIFQLRHGDKIKIKEKMDDFMERRKTKQPLEYPSAGSTFKRPKGNYASALIEQCGLKGKSVGDAQVSEKHSGFIINRGHATCKEVMELIKTVQDTVKEKTGYHLECEVKRLV